MKSGKHAVKGTVNKVISIVGTLAMPMSLSTHSMAADPLKVCADPDNLPFSRSEGPERGLYVELAELVAKK